MNATRLFELFPAAALAGWGVLGLGRAWMFHRRGVRVLAGDRQRRWGELTIDSAAGLCLLVWGYEIIATAWPTARLFSWPAAFNVVLIDNLPVKVVGAALMAAGVGLYGIALRHLGMSWRLGIDRNSPGPLITGGIYAWSRHPIYFAFDLAFIGTFLVQGRILFLALAAIMFCLLHSIMLREERFLSEVYREAYLNYCRRTGRYWSFPRG